MAKLKDLAGLAALGVLGYKLSQRGKDQSGGMTGDQNDTLARVNSQSAMTPAQNDTLERVNREEETHWNDGCAKYSVGKGQSRDEQGIGHCRQR